MHLLPRDSECRRARCAWHAALACRWRSQLARRTTGMHRKRKASRRRNVLSMGKGQPESGRHGVRKQKARVPRLLHTDSKRSSARRAWHAALARRWRPQLERRTTGTRRSREASRQRSVLLDDEHGPTTISPARRAQAASSSAAPYSYRHPAPRPTRARGVIAGCAKWRP